MSDATQMKRLRKFNLADFVGLARLTAVLLLCSSVLLPSLGAEQLHGRSVTVAGNEVPEQRAWDMLRTGIKESNTKKRTKAVSALQLLLGNAEATEMAITALQDPKLQVRAAAATALGLIGSKEAIPARRNAISDIN